MSLALVQGYQSDSEHELDLLSSPPSSPSRPGVAQAVDDDQDDDAQAVEASRSSLPSPLDAFAQICGPPAFLKHCVSVDNRSEQQHHGAGRRPRKADAVMEAGPAPAATGAGKQQDAAELLRLCVQCGVAMTYSEGKGLVCPVCRDSATRRGVQEVEKKRTRVKDREKSKRIRGQSSHSSWKSETEMQLRQHFD